MLKLVDSYELLFSQLFFYIVSEAFEALLSLAPENVRAVSKRRFITAFFYDSSFFIVG
jgi:hypothetical protein